MPIEPLQPEQKLSSEQKVQDLSVSPDIGNTHVSGLPLLSHQKIKLLTVEPFSKYNYSMLTFEVDGKEEKHGLSDSVLIGIIKEKEKLAVKKDVVSQNRQTTPAFV